MPIIGESQKYYREQAAKIERPRRAPLSRKQAIKYGHGCCSLAILAFMILVILAIAVGVIQAG